MSLIPGCKVKLISSGEVGIVIHSWVNEELATIDCHIAFYGSEFPIGQPKKPPYVLRYLASSLEIVSE